MQFWAIVLDSFRDAVDRKIFWVLVAITLVIVATMLSVGIEGNRIVFLFGLLSTESAYVAPAFASGGGWLAGVVVWVFLSMILGWMGIILMVIATSDIFPAMMERGAIDVLVSKPISRPRLFLYKYASSLVFVLLQATLFVGLTFLVMGLRWGVWRPGYLATIPLLALLFSYVFCVSALVGVKTRSPVAAILLSIVAWAGFALVHQAPQLFEVFPAMKKHQTAYAVIRLVGWIPPKTGDFDYLAARCAGVGPSMDILPASSKDSMNETEREQLGRAREIEEKELLKNPVYSIGSSLLFEAVVVLMAMWSFSRKDY